MFRRGDKMARKGSMDLAGFDVDTDGAPDSDNFRDNSLGGGGDSGNGGGVDSAVLAPDVPQMDVGAVYDAVRSGGAGRRASDDGATSTYSRSMSMSMSTSTSPAASPGKGFGGSGLKSKLARRNSNANSKHSGGTAPSSRSGSGYTSNSRGTNIWSRLLTPANDALWDGITGETFDNDRDDEEDSLLYDPDARVGSCRTHARNCGLSAWYETRHFARTCLKHPAILFLSAVAFAALCAAGISAVTAQRDSAIQKAQHTARFIASETGDWFNAEFRRAMQPLYSVQQAVIHSGYFDDLPARIGPYPSRVKDTNTTGGKVYRDVTGICDDEDLKAKWRSIVEPINRNSNMDGIIVGYRLYPGNVMCLAEPMINTRDFPPGKNLSHAKFWGYDAGHDSSPFWTATTLDLFVERNPNMNVFGPFSNPVLPEGYCGHLPVWVPPGPDAADAPGASPDDTKVVLDVHGEPVPNAFGFVMNFLHWQKLKDRSDIYDRFLDCGVEFCLTRTDGPDRDGEYTVKTIAESDGCPLLDGTNSILVEIETLNGLWVNRVGRLDAWAQPWYPYAVLAVVLASFLLSCLTAAVLVERQLHRNLLYKVMPKRAIAKLHRGQTVLERFNLVTIFFSDIVGFTSMAGEMRPVQVMKMLNELYTELDKLVERHGVYKVETIGDAYMVVGGAPDRRPAPEAAERVALFALDAIEFVRNFRTKDGDRIFIRAGLASGPVVAGVVGNAMPRYCFFGDTVNFASRMESTSVKMRVQCAEITYRLLQDAPASVFALEERREGDQVGVQVKGKGLQHTWWIKGAQRRTGDEHLKPKALPAVDIETPQPSRRSSYDVAGAEPQVANEEGSASVPPMMMYEALTSQEWPMLGQPDSDLVAATADKETMIDRISCVLEYHLQRVVLARDGRSSVDARIGGQIRKFVSAIEGTYNDVHFHSFQHACHVLISMNKLVDILRREPPACVESGEPIVQNPLIDFSLVFAALVHDAGHTGMSNKILTEQQHPLARRYSEGDAPIAERNSIDLGLRILFQEEFNDLRAAIIPAELDRVQFGKALFQSILVTDIASKERMRLCVKRYEIASGPSLDDKICSCPTCRNDRLGSNLISQMGASERSCGSTESNSEDSTSSSASSNYDAGLCPLSSHLAEIMEGVSLTKSVKEKYPKEFVITHCGLNRCVLNEHLMQVSDVAHLMQSWPTFIKWNFRLYKEILACHRNGLCEDPSNGWYEGQIGFLENYVIPLAKRTQVYFSKDSAEDLVWLAEANLKLWKEHGKKATATMLTGAKYGADENIILQSISALPETR